MYSGKHGKSGSTKPIKKKKPSWLRYSAKEIEHLIVKLGKEGLDSSKIGLILRDTYGVPDVMAVLKKEITKVLEENKLKKELPEDLGNLLKRQAAIAKHLEANKKDEVAKRGLQLTESKIKRLVKYYQKQRKLPKNWKFESKLIKVKK